jgi:hypothetical protein
MDILSFSAFLMIGFFESVTVIYMRPWCNSKD